MEPKFLSPAIWSFAADHALVWLLVVVRLSGLLAVLPGLGQERLPVVIRAALASLTALIIMPVIPRPTALPTGIWGLIPLLVTEFLSGLLLGLVVAWIMDAVAFAGQLMDTQMGFSFVQILDPSSGASSSVSGAIMLQITLLFIFLSGLHHQMILALVESYRLVPIGGGVPLHMQDIIVMTGQLLARGLQLASPVLLTLFFVDVLEGIAAKLLPQLQLIQLAFPLKISIGLAVFIILMKEFSAWLLPLFQQAPLEGLRLLR